MKTLEARIISDTVIFTTFRQEVPDDTTPEQFAAQVQARLDDGTLYGEDGWCSLWNTDFENTTGDRVEAVSPGDGTKEVPVSFRRGRFAACPAFLIEKYRRLQDGLSDMVEEGRLSAAEIPDDYQWLADSLAELAGLDSGPVELPPHMRATGQGKGTTPIRPAELLRRMLDDWPQFDTGEEINGADLVDWMQAFYADAKAIVAAALAESDLLFTLADWKAAVAEGRTVEGYTDWLAKARAKYRAALESQQCGHYGEVKDRLRR